MLATRGVDKMAIEAAYAAAPREAFFGPRLDDRSPFGGALPHAILVKPRAQSAGEWPRGGDRDLANRER
jgi:hypothetical protein